MILKCFFIILPFWTLINANVYLNEVAKIEDQLMKIKSDTKMDLTEKYFRVMTLSKVLNNLIALRTLQVNNNLKSQIKKEKKLEREELESSIIKKYLLEKMGGSSFGMDFHTMRIK